MNKAAHQLPDGRWELGSDFHTSMVKSAHALVSKLPANANYGKLKAWQSSVEDWVYSNTQILPDKLGPSAVRSVARMSLDPELYSALEGDGALGGRYGGRVTDARWEVLMEHLRDRLGCSRVNLKLGLACLKQESRPMKEFAREFERRALDAELTEEDAKAHLVGNLNRDSLMKLDTFVTTQDPSAAAAKETIQQRLGRVSYASMISFLKQSNLTDIAS